MMMRNILGAIALCFGLIFPVNAMPFDPLIGTWKVIDDRTGYYVAEIVIRKNSKSLQYSAVITQNLSSASVSNAGLCTKCQGALKNQPIKGMQALEGLIANSAPKQFTQGQWLDPNDGLVYKVEARLNTANNQMKVFGKAKHANVTTAMTWKKL
ncbi:DUF2147 domain-containing protein [Acinetobacter towneri]|uniref:DUF2147 domain-containing protein n=1 Tax=Acinetobacter towneri TaxID=202956 RepID=UPI001D0E9BD1|nr:DUF2147 domain-containing protein [Acinetobacter towneri]